MTDARFTNKVNFAFGPGDSVDPEAEYRRDVVRLLTEIRDALSDKPDLGAVRRTKYQAAEMVRRTFAEVGEPDGQEMRSKG
jgi:hypothetical protein